MNRRDSLERITTAIIKRSAPGRAVYLQRAAQFAQSHRSQAGKHTARHHLSYSNLAHATAAAPAPAKRLLLSDAVPNLGIITAYNDMLSAHQPYEAYPPMLRALASEMGAVAQVAGSVPAMCDGITQGQPGMELSLFSRDVIAMASAVGLSHNAFDGVIYLGICDKIVPGLLIAAASFGWLPAIFIPSGPMPSGMTNHQKNQIRQAYAVGRADTTELLEAETQSYHSPGTCTFYGTANTNQMLLELMGLMVPGASFASPGGELRQQLTRYAMHRAVANAQAGRSFASLVDERSLVNAMVGLLATGGSTNSAMHLLVVAAAAGITINWDDYAQLSALVPLLARVYPNGKADVNQFDRAGGINAVVAELLGAGLLHQNVHTVVGQGLDAYARRPQLAGNGLAWQQATPGSPQVLRGMDAPFAQRGGLSLVQGELGQAIVKTSAVAAQHLCLRAPAIVFDAQQDFMAAFHRGECTTDHIAVVRFQGPKANGMPELHKLVPLLGELQDQGYRVALVTDGRLSGASGRVAAAIHLCPEAADGGLLAKIATGDMLALDVPKGVLKLENAEAIARRPAAQPPAGTNYGCGRELFSVFRAHADNANLGASLFGDFGLHTS